MTMNNKKLERSNNRMIAGVCAGLAEFFGIDKYLFDIAPPGSDPEQGVVDFFENFSDVHFLFLRCVFCGKKQSLRFVKNPYKSYDVQRDAS